MSTASRARPERRPRLVEPAERRERQRQLHPGVRGLVVVPAGEPDMHRAQCVIVATLDRRQQRMRTLVREACIGRRHCRLDGDERVRVATEMHRRVRVRHASAQVARIAGSASKPRGSPPWPRPASAPRGHERLALHRLHEQAGLRQPVPVEPPRTSFIEAHRALHEWDRRRTKASPRRSCHVDRPERRGYHARLSRGVA